MALWHGGVPGLGPGGIIRPGATRRQHAGCPYCEARARGETIDGIDPPSARPDRVYVTADKEYARFYASLYGEGDLYRVEAVGEMIETTEDHFPSFTVEAARVLGVYARAVLLTPKQRRRQYRRWIDADRRALLRPVPGG